MAAAPQPVPVPVTNVATSDSAYRMMMKTPNLRNGDAATFGLVHVSEGIPTPWKWPSDATFANIHPMDATHSGAERIASEAAIYATGLAKSPGVAASIAVRTKALICAAARAQIRHAWGITDNDIEANQLLVTNVQVEATGTHTAGIADIGTAADLEVERVAIRAMYDEMSQDFLAKVVRAAMGVPVVVGVILVQTGTHHFVEPHKKIATAISNQVFGARSVVAPNITTDEFDDALYHKAAHPIRTDLMTSWARAEDTKVKLCAVGLASAGVRVPAKFAPERAASAFHAIVHQAATAARTANVAANVATVDAMLTEVSSAIAADASPAGQLAAEGILNRFVAANGVDIAWLTGFYRAELQEAGLNLTTQSVFRAYSITRVLAEHPASAASGANHHSDAMRWRRNRAREGYLPGIGIFGAPQPADFGSLPAGNVSAP